MRRIFLFSAKEKSHAVYHAAEMEENIYGVGALVRDLPPYSPDFNPIKGSYHQAKDFIHAFILHAFAQISPENCEVTVRLNQSF